MNTLFSPSGVAVLLGVIGFAGAGIWWLTNGQSKTRAGANRSATEAEPTTVRSTGAEPKRSQPERSAPEPDKETGELDRSKIVIHGLLQSVSDSIATLLEENKSYGDALERHKVSVRKAETLESIRKVEALLIAEVEEMQATNATYRKQLDDANTRAEEQQQKLEELQENLGLDFLTEVPNRRSFEERLAEELQRANRYNNACSLVIFDIDHFKEVNDRFGHIAGDRILRAIARLFSQQVRSADFLARYGGEEFVLILPETNAKRAKILAEKIRKKVEGAVFRLENKTLNVTISGGVGEVQPENDTPEDIFERVDAALYCAKRRGRNCIDVAELEVH